MRKFFGVILIILAVLLSLGVLAQLPSILILVFGQSSESTAYVVGFSFGYFIGVAIYGVGAFFSWKYGLRNLRSS